MKVLCLADEGIKKESFVKAVNNNLGKADAAFEVIDEYGKDGLFIIETQGPGAIEIPKGFYNHEDAEIIIGSILCPFSKEIMDMFPNLKVIGTCRGGLENVDMEACKERNIMVVNGFGRNAEAVSDFTMAIMLSEVRNVARSHSNLVTNPKAWTTNWVSSPYVPHIKECTVGIFGFGNIGRLVAKKLSGFGCKIMIYDPYVTDENIKASGYIPADKETLFKEADIVTIHSRLVEATKGIIGRKEIELMKPTAYFINTARAGLVDYDALLEALQNKKIGGAALDVFPDEPLPGNSPWRKLDNCTITEHMAGAVLASRSYAASLVAESIANAIKGVDVPQIITKDLMKDEAYKAWALRAIEELGL